MTSPNFEQSFQQLTASLESEREQLKAMERDLAFQVEPRPIPEGLIAKGIPLGHIAFMGDFDTPPRSNPA